jgi:hypothetical protein
MTANVQRCVDRSLLGLEDTEAKGSGGIIEAVEKSANNIHDKFIIMSGSNYLPV